MKKKEYLDKIIVWDFKHTGEIQINIDLIKDNWSHLWYINFTNFWDNPHYRIIKLLRKDSEITDIKITISKEQAMKIVKELNLIYHKSFLFNHAWHYDSIISE